MRVFIFGASSYIGQRVARRLVEEGHIVTGFVRSAQSAQAVRALGAQALVGGLDDLVATGSALEANDAAI